MNYDEARNIIAEHVAPMTSECLPLSESAGRVSASNITAEHNVPSFDRSPYDGYAFRSEDTAKAPVTLRVIEEIRAGSVARMPLKSGEAAKILTGAMIPEGADAVIPYEDTKFTDTEVTLSRAFRSGENIITSGEDVKAGHVIVQAGDFIDAGKAGLIASQGISILEVHKIPAIGIISTGNELQDLDSELAEGKIYNTSRYAFETALKLSGFNPKFIGTANDNEEEITGIIIKALSVCDALIITGGVSAGDYDLTPKALNILGAEIIVRDVALKPGGKCVYSLMNDKLICCLSGNPASALTNYYAVALPALKKLSGLKDYMPHEIDVVLENAFNKQSPKTRIIRGRLKFKDGLAVMNVPSEQGNGVLSSMSGSNVMAIIPSGSGKLPEGTKLKGFMI